MLVSLLVLFLFLLFLLTLLIMTRLGSRDLVLELVHEPLFVFTFVLILFVPNFVFILLMWLTLELVHEPLFVFTFVFIILMWLTLELVHEPLFVLTFVLIMFVLIFVLTFLFLSSYKDHNNHRAKRWMKGVLSGSVSWSRTIQSFLNNQDNYNHQTKMES